MFVETALYQFGMKEDVKENTLWYRRANLTRLELSILKVISNIITQKHQFVKKQSFTGTLGNNF